MARNEGGLILFSGMTPLLAAAAAELFLLL